MSLNKPLRVAIDGRKLHDFGIGSYVHNILAELTKLDSATEYVVLCRPGEPEARSGNLGENFRWVPVDAASYSLQEQWRVPLALARARVHLLHEPHYVLPPATPCPAVVTIHDCIHLMFPQYLPHRAAYLYARAAMWAATQKARRILTVSEASKRDILHYFRVPEERISVIYNAIDERFFVEPDEAHVERVKERFQLDHPFALYVGNIKPHKNVTGLIDAFGRARALGLDDMKLVVIGDELSKYPGLRQGVHRHRLDKHVRFFGFQPLETLSVFYRLARVFVFPSFYEGFGLPPLEAMACGTPVVTSHVSSMPEVAGGAAVLVDPHRPDEIADGIVRAATDEALRANLIARGKARAREFSWARSVAQIRRIYSDVLE